MWKRLKVNRIFFVRSTRSDEKEESERRTSRKGKQLMMLEMLGKSEDADSGVGSSFEDENCSLGRRLFAEGSLR